MTRSIPDQITLAVTETLSVDVTARTITGLCLPFGVATDPDLTWISWQFGPGVVQIPDPASRVKMRLDHDRRNTFGVATEIVETEQGLTATFSVGHTPFGDEMLQLAADGVLDGLSVGLRKIVVADDADLDGDDPVLVVSADLYEVSLTSDPAFPDARVSRVAMSVPDQAENPAPVTTPDDEEPEMDLEAFGAQLTAALTASQEAMADRFAAQLAAHTPPPRIDPTADLDLAAQPYRLDRRGRLVQAEGMNFAADIMSRDPERQARALDFVAQTFAVTTPGSVAPGTEWRPDLAPGILDYQRPLTSLLTVGECDSQSFNFPVISGGSVETPAWGNEVADSTIEVTLPAVQPVPVAGKVVVPRAFVDGATPQASQWLYDQLVLAYKDGVERHIVARIVAAAGSIPNLTLAAGAADGALTSQLLGELAALWFSPGVATPNSVLATQQTLYRKLADAKDSTGRQILPYLSPSNAAGSTRTKLGSLDVGGYEAVPSWALTPAPGTPESSWLVSPQAVSAWHSAPKKIEIEGVSIVTVGIYGYAAAVVTRPSVCREVVYDSTP